MMNKSNYTDTYLKQFVDGRCGEFPSCTVHQIINRLRVAFQPRHTLSIPTFRFRYKVLDLVDKELTEVKNS